MHNRPEQLTLEERAVQRRAAAADVAAALSLASRERNIRERRILLALAARITDCNQPSNHWIIREPVLRDTGELLPHPRTGNYWRCDSKLCPNCVSYRARMHRNRLRAICERIKPKRGERYRFATLTMLNPGLPLLKTRELINRAWTLFRKRSLCVSLIRGAAKSEEFTVTPNGYHYHIHLMVLSRWIPQAELARVWTDCVETAFNEANVHFDVSHTKHNRLNVDIREIRTAENGIKEVSKYITKSDSWLKLPGNVLAEIGLVERWHRMHELIGEFATINRAMKRPPKAKKPPFLDTQPVNDASRPFESASDSNCNETPTYWRRQAERMTSPEYLVQLHLDQQNAREARLRYLTTNFAEPIIESMQDAINNYYDRGS